MEKISFEINPTKEQVLRVFLGADCSSIVKSYLPLLPYIEELEVDTAQVAQILSHRYFYADCYVCLDDRTVHRSTDGDTYRWQWRIGLTKLQQWSIYPRPVVGI